MKELIQSIISTSKERISNPLIGTYLVSWIAFNWKPIIFLIYSDQNIENKIRYIDLNFSNINNILLWPLVAMIIYVLIIPYLNLIFESLLEFARVKRNIISILQQKQQIENKKQLAIEEIKLQEAQVDFKERKNHNNLIEDLQKSIQNTEEQLLIERERFYNLDIKRKEESTFLNNRFKEDKNEFESKLKSLINENKYLRENLLKIEKDSILLKNTDVIRNENGNLILNEDVFSKDEIQLLKLKGKKL